MRISILIPLYNEEETIKELLRRVIKVKLPKGLSKEIIVVDDGSTDESQRNVKLFKSNIKLVRNYKNQGKGAAIRKGLNKATGELVVIQDADLEYHPLDIPKLLKPFADKRVKVVYGSRVLGKNKPSHWTFNFGGRLVTFVTNILYGTNLTDEPTGYKVFRKDLLNSLELKANGFEFCPEVTAKIAKRGIKIFEVPIKYTPRPPSEKKIKWHDGILAIYFLFKFKFSE